MTQRQRCGNCQWVIYDEESCGKCGSSLTTLYTKRDRSFILDDVQGEEKKMKSRCGSLDNKLLISSERIPVVLIHDVIRIAGLTKIKSRPTPIEMNHLYGDNVIRNLDEILYIHKFWNNIGESLRETLDSRDKKISWASFTPNEKDFSRELYSFMTKRGLACSTSFKSSDKIMYVKHYIH